MPALPGTDLYSAIIHSLIEVRKGKGVRQADLAQALGRPQSFVSKYENGERILDVAEYVTVANALGASPVELLAEAIKPFGQETREK